MHAYSYAYMHTYILTCAYLSRNNRIQTIQFNDPFDKLLVLKT